MTAFLALALAAAGPTLHLKVDGPGFVRLLQDGSTVYMNDLTATVHEGRLVGPGRRPILPEVQVGSAAGLSIQSDGWVMADGRRAGRIMVALLSSRREISAGVWTTPDRPTVGWPGDDRFGRFSIGSTASAPAPLPSPTPSSPTGGLTLPALLEVSGDQIGLHAALGLPIPADGDPSLGTTPPFGVTRRLSLRTIQATAQRSGLNRTISGPDWVEVRRQGQVLSIDRLVESARSVMQGFPAASLLPGQTDLTVPTGTLQLRAGEPAVTPSRITVSVEIVVDG
ncbi:MAG: hypothetical protein MH204_11670, partial [Fimbriimonadaceae bacterium]|nr:hypothetical protein [Fimbriimonadaceae bacterium]